MKPLLARFAKGCFWGSVCILAFPLASVLAEETARPSELSTIERTSRSDNVALPANANTAEQQLIRRLMRPGRANHLQLGSDLHGLA